MNIESENGQCVSKNDGRVGGSVENKDVATSSISYDDDPKADGKDEMLIDISLPDEYPIAPKRQKVGEVEGSSDSVFSMQDFDSNLNYEQSFEERRFAQLIQLGLEGGRNEEENSQTGSHESAETVGELFPSVLPPVLGENLLATMDGSGVNDDLIQGSTIPDSVHVCSVFYHFCYYSLLQVSFSWKGVSLSTQNITYIQRCSWQGGWGL